MNFLISLNPLTWLSDGLEKIAGAILQGIRTLCYSLDTLIYRLIISAYDMFRLLCTGRLLSQDLLNEMAERIGIILGVIMFFNVCFSFIKMLLEPDKLNDKDAGAGAIIKKSILVIIMLGISSFAFDTLYKVQKSIVESNVISKLILPYTIEANDGEDGLDKFGNILSMELLMSFYAVDTTLVATDTEGQSQIALCEAYTTSLQNQIYNLGKFDFGYNCLNEAVKANVSNGSSTEQQEVFIVDFNWLFSVIAGGIVLYLMIMYCFKVGVRMIQLAVLEVISPMAFVSYLSPKKDTMLSKWRKIYVSTYIDVFIRIAIINFVVFLIAAIFDAQGLSGIEFWNSMGLNPDTTSFATKAFLNVVIILALLTFAHKAPELIKELIPASASKLGFGASMKDIVGLQKGIGMVAGAATGAAVGFLGGKGIGMFGGILRGAHAGFGAKNIHSAFGAARKSQAEHNVAARLGQIPGIGDRFSTAMGGMTTKEQYDNQVSDLEELIENEKVNTAAIRRRSAALSNASGYKKKLEERAENKLLNDHFNDGDIRKTMQEQLLKQQAKIKVAERSGNASAIAQAQMEYNEQLDKYKQEYITRAARGQITDNGMNSIFDDFENEIRINADGAFDGMSFDRNDGYAGVKAFDDTATTRNATISRDINASDAHIKGIENQIQSIKNSQGYRDSHKIK